MSINVSAASLGSSHGVVRPSIKNQACQLITRVWNAVSEVFRNCWRFLTSCCCLKLAEKKITLPQVPSVLLADWAEPLFPSHCNLLNPQSTWFFLRPATPSVKMAVVVRVGTKVVQCCFDTIGSAAQGKVKLREAFSQRVNPDEASMMTLLVDGNRNVYIKENTPGCVPQIRYHEYMSKEALSAFVVKTCDAFNSSITEKVRQHIGV